MGSLKQFVKKGNLTANGQTLVLDVTQAHSAVILLSGTYSMTIQFEVSDDDATVWYPVRAASASSDTNTSSQTTASQTVAYELNVSNYSRLRVRVSAFTSGNCAVNLTASDAEAEPNPTVGGTVGLTSGAAVVATPLTPTAVSTVSTASTNLAAVKASAGTLFNVVCSNPTATPAFVKLYNKTTSPTLASDVPLLTIPVPANSIVVTDLGALGARFGTGIARAITGAIAATDATNAVAGVQVLISHN